MDFTLEKEYNSLGYAVVCGTDEAGRGPLAGPVFAAACVLPTDIVIDGLNDSKKLTEKKREKLFDIIKEKAVSWCIASASVEEIDSLNILNASQLAMRRAVEGLDIKADAVLVDGNVARDFPIKAVTVVKGDAISPSIAAASILAKVARDRYCIEMDKEYPMYGFAKHKGYGTRDHMNAVRTYGPCPMHRMSFMSFLWK